jgi:hypothetical protein
MEIKVNVYTPILHVKDNEDYKYIEYWNLFYT